MSEVPLEAFVTISDNVGKRGYREGWTPEQFQARQVVKMAEEMCEALGNTGLPATPTADSVIALASSLKEMCDVLFHDMESWKNIKPQIDGVTDSELADVLVCIANYTTSRKTNLIQLAMAKSEADIIRGVG